MIYFLEDSATRRIKIGTSIDPSRRVREIQTSSPTKLLAITEGGKQEERALHERFSHLREHGEWFTPDWDLWEFIANIPGHNLELSQQLISRECAETILPALIAKISFDDPGAYATGLTWSMEDGVGESKKDWHSDMTRAFPGPVGYLGDLDRALNMSEGIEEEIFDAIVAYRRLIRRAIAESRFEQRFVPSFVRWMLESRWNWTDAEHLQPWRRTARRA